MQKNSDFNHHIKCEILATTHLSFVDDVFLFSIGDIKFVEMILGAFNSFSKSKGLIMNHSKCKLFCGGMENDVVDAVQNLTGFVVGQFPIRYLGVSLSCKKLNLNHYLPVVDRITSRIRH